MIKPFMTAGWDCNTISWESEWIQWMLIRRPDSFMIWVEREVGMLVTTLFKIKYSAQVFKVVRK